MTKQHPGGFPPEMIVFRGSSVRVQPRGDEKSAKAQEWRLLRHLLTGRSVHWLDGFLLFEEWRTKEQKGQYVDRFMSLVSKAKACLLEMEVEDATIESAKGYWKLRWTGDQAKDSSVAEGLRLTEKAVEAFCNEDAVAGWAFIRDAWAQWPDASSLSRAVSLSPQLPADHKNYGECLAETKRCIEAYQEALLGAVAKVTALVSSSHEGLSFEVASDALGRWIGESFVVREALSRMAGYVPKKPEKVDKATQHFLAMSQRYLENYADAGADEDDLVQKEMDKKERDRLWEKLRDEDFVARAVEEVIRSYEGLGHLRVDAEEVRKSREGALFEFLHSRAFSAKAPLPLYGRFVVCLKKHVEMNRGTRILRETADDRMVLEERKAKVKRLLAELEGKGDLHASVKRIIDEMAQPEKLQDVPDVAKAPEGLRRYFESFGSFMEERTKDFVGRKFVFEELEKFFEVYRSGYFVITGDPGIGKSSVMAQLVKSHGLSVYHFNIATDGINTLQQFLENVCARLIVAYELPYSSLPEGYNESGAFLRVLLAEASKKLGKGERLVIPVDALDEVDQQRGGGNLFLPQSLPDNVFIVVTSRRGTESRLSVMDQYPLDLEDHREDNLADAKRHVERQVKSTGIARWIKDRGLGEMEFVEAIVARSEGNFMYLRHVLPDIGRGVYKDGALDAIPVGLTRYYEDHWKRMGAMNEEPLRTKIRAVYILSLVPKPVSCELLADFLEEDGVRVQGILDGWAAFLHRQDVDGQPRFSLYHNTFREFLHRKDVVRMAGLELKDVAKQIRDNLWQELYGE